MDITLPWTLGWVSLEEYEIYYPYLLVLGGVLPPVMGVLVQLGEEIVDYMVKIVIWRELPPLITIKFYYMLLLSPF